MILKAGSASIYEYDPEKYSESIQIIGHLHSDINLSVSVVVSNRNAEITMQSFGERVRNWAYKINLTDAKNLLDLSIPGSAKQTQHLISLDSQDCKVVTHSGHYEPHLLSVPPLPTSQSTHEIERKFLIDPRFDYTQYESIKISQGYISSDPERTIRIRTAGKKAFLTVKGIGSQSGASRYEFEMEISTPNALTLFEYCEPGAIQKTRYLVPIGSHIFEVDVFAGDNIGLIVAEIELRSETEHFERPIWLREEVTGRKEYYNACLAKRPYSKWVNKMD
jgi:adenylate cyclase